MAKITDKLREKRNILIFSTFKENLSVEELSAIFNLTKPAIYNILKLYEDKIDPK